MLFLHFISLIYNFFCNSFYNLQHCNKVIIIALLQGGTPTRLISSRLITTRLKIKIRILEKKFKEKSQNVNSISDEH